jgi:hypothetical protein
MALFFVTVLTDSQRSNFQLEFYSDAPANQALKLSFDAMAFVRTARLAPAPLAV